MSSSILFKPHPELLETYGNGLASATHFNMSGDYSYMSAGYYASLDAELHTLNVIPTTADALDAYVVPIAMEKARKHGVPTLDYEIVTDKLVCPSLAYPINPFSIKYDLVTEGDDLEAKLKAVTMTGKYAAICQKLPNDYRVDVMRCILGRALVKEYAGFARQVFEVFKLPLMRVRVVVTASQYYLSAIEPLPFDDLTLNEKKILTGLGVWQG